jgi:hypothetical protein
MGFFPAASAIFAGDLVLETKSWQSEAKTARM